LIKKPIKSNNLGTRPSTKAIEVKSPVADWAATMGTCPPDKVKKSFNNVARP